IVCSQSPKGLAFPFRAGWNDVADLDGTVSDDHAVDQQFEQRPLLIEVCFRQALPNTAAERLGMGCQPGRLAVPLRIMHEVMLLAFNGLQPGLGITPTPLKLAQWHHPGEISLCEPFDLLAEGAVNSGASLWPRLSRYTETAPATPVQSPSPTPAREGLPFGDVRFTALTLGWAHALRSSVV